MRMAARSSLTGCEVLIVQLLRHALSKDLIQQGALAGASNIFFARALSAIHARPGHAWSITSLADEAGMSRSAFSRLPRSDRRDAGNLPHRLPDRCRATAAGREPPGKRRCARGRLWQPAGLYQGIHAPAGHVPARMDQADEPCLILPARGELDVRELTDWPETFAYK